MIDAPTASTTILATIMVLSSNAFTINIINFIQLKIDLQLVLLAGVPAGVGVVYGHVVADAPKGAGEREGVEQVVQPVPVFGPDVGSADPNHVETGGGHGTEERYV